MESIDLVVECEGVDVDLMGGSVFLRGAYVSEILNEIGQDPVARSAIIHWVTKQKLDTEDYRLLKRRIYDHEILLTCRRCGRLPNLVPISTEQAGTGYKYGFDCSCSPAQNVHCYPTREGAAIDWNKKQEG